MISEFRKKKLTHIFNCYDFDGDGYIELEDDFLRYLGVLVDEGFVKADSDKFKEMRSETIALWNDIREKADQNRDERVSLDEWLAWQDDLSEKVEAGATFPFEQYFATQFSILDVDGSGSVSVDEYKLALRMYGVEMAAGEAEKLFKHFDKNGDGLMSREEAAEVNATFWYSEDPEAVENKIYGDF